MMTPALLAPLNLLAALAVAVPVAIHLLQRRREATVEFPAVRFLLLAQRRSARRLRLRRLLLLALRCLAVVLFAVILARPVLRAPGAQFREGAAGRTAVILDTSLSMSARGGVHARFEQARALAAALGERGGERERLALIEAAPLPGAAATARWLEPARFVEAVAATAVRPAVADPARAFAEAYRLLGDGGGGPGRIVVITDLARGGWERFSLAALPALDPGVPVRVLRLGGDGARNRAGVLRITAAGESRVAGEPRQVVAEIANYGPERTLPVELRLDGAPVANRLESVAPGTTARAVFTLRPPEAGAHRIEVRLPPDPYAADDSRRLGIEVSPPVGVLVVDGEPAASLLASESFFVQEALRPERLSVTVPIRVSVAGPEAPVAGPGPGQQVVVLANVRAPGEAAAARLAEHVAAGGGLILFWGRNCDAEAYRRSLGALLPAPATGTEELPGERPARIGEVDYDAEPLGVFRPPSGGSFATAAFAWRAVLGAGRPAARVLARFADGSPWLLEQAVGRGRVVFFASTADLEGNDLATRPVFVPLLQRLVLWLAGGLSATEDAELTAGEEKAFVGGPELVGTPLSVETPEGSRREIAFRPDGGGSRAAFGGTAVPGFYRWSRPGSEGVFAVNVPAAESDLSALGPEELEERFRPVGAELVEIAPGAAPEEVARSGLRSLTRPLLAALAVLLLLESAVAGPRRRGAGQGDPAQPSRASAGGAAGSPR